MNEVINDEDLKEMMAQANPKLKNLINEGKGDDESIFKISQAQFNQLLDRIKYWKLNNQINYIFIQFLNHNKV